MFKEIIIRDSGPSIRSRFNLNAGGNHIEIVIRDAESGEMTTIFTGEEFSPEVYETQGGMAEEERYLELFPPREKKAIR